LGIRNWKIDKGFKVKKVQKLEGFGGELGNWNIGRLTKVSRLRRFKSWEVLEGNWKNLSAVLD
jgi:hypothetical protein